MDPIDPATVFRSQTMRLPRPSTLLWSLTIALMTAGWGPAFASQDEPRRASGPRSSAKGAHSPSGQGNSLDFRVVDAQDKTPLPDVSIVFRAGSASGTTVLASDMTLATDEDGRCRIAVPKQAMYFVGISARKEGFVPVQVTWQRHDFGVELPESYTLAPRARYAHRRHSPRHAGTADFGSPRLCFLRP